MNTLRITIVLNCIVILLTGCEGYRQAVRNVGHGFGAIDTNDLHRMQAGGDAGRSAPSSEHLQLMSATNGYQLPTSSIPPTAHPDGRIYRTALSMQSIAATQGLIFDGSRASEGIVIVGKMGAADQMVLAFSVYAVGDRIATQDTHHCKAADIQECLSMRSRFMAAIQ